MNAEIQPTTSDNPDYTAFLEWCEATIAKYRSALNLEHYRVHLSRKPSETELGGMEVECAYPYLQGYIHWAEDDFKQFQLGDFQFLEFTILHELTHLIVAPLKKLALGRCFRDEEIRDAVETMVDHVSIYTHRMLRDLGKATK